MAARIPRKGFLLLPVPLILAVFFAFFLPYGAAFRNALGAAGDVSVWNNAALWRITAFTIKQAFLSVLLSLAIGLPGAILLGRGKGRLVPLLRAITAIPFAMPSILVVLGFVLFFGNSGWLNRAFAAIMGRDEGPFRILYKPAAIVLAHGFFNFPIVIRLAGDGLARVRRAYSPAAASLGAPPIAVFFTVVLPISLPAIISAALLVFLYSFASFAVVLVLGGGPAGTTLAVEIYRHARIFHNYSNAGLLALIETLIAVSVFLAYSFFRRKFAWIKTEIRDREFEVVNPALSRAAMVLYLIPAMIFILGPPLSVALESFLYRPSRAAAQALSLRWWASLGGACLPALARSLILAFSSASLACVIAFMAAGAEKIAETEGAAGIPLLMSIMRFFASAPLVSSGIVMGLGWLIIYGRDLSRSPFALAAALILLHAVIAMPFAFSSISEGFRALPAGTLNAAIAFGSSPIRALLNTALPLSMRRIRSAWGFAAALSLGELNAIMMLGIESWETLPLYIYRAAGAYRYGSACAAGTILILCCALAFILSESGGKENAA